MDRGSTAAFAQMCSSISSCHFNQLQIVNDICHINYYVTRSPGTINCTIYDINWTVILLLGLTIFSLPAPGQRQPRQARRTKLTVPDGHDFCNWFVSRIKASYILNYTNKMLNRCLLFSQRSVRHCRICHLHCKEVCLTIIFTSPLIVTANNYDIVPQSPLCYNLGCHTPESGQRVGQSVQVIE